MIKRYYAGIGSRTTPQNICDEMTRIASCLETKGFILRSGRAKGADQAFENGVKDPNNKEIFIPKNWISNPLTLEIAKTIHPAWHNCTPYAKACHERNVCQVIGVDLNTPVEFVVCWTPEAKEFGGTRTALVLAKKHKIPIWNLADEKQFKEFLMRLGEL